MNTPLLIDVRRGAIAGLGALLAGGRISAGGGVAVIVGPGQGERMGKLIRTELGSADVFLVVGGSLDSAMELGDRLRGRPYAAVIGMGGGKTIDAAKFAASRHAIPMFSAPTSLANDSLASPVASLDHDGGKFSHIVPMPIAVVVDIDLVERAPAHQNRAGIGDAVSNMNAVADWELGHRVCGEPIDGLAVALARTGAEALINHPGTVTSEGFLTTLAEALILGGIAMSSCGSSRPASGGCHKISHAIDQLFPHTALHGEQVGLGALFCTFLRGDWGPFADLADCLRRHRLPVLPADLGLSDEQFTAAVDLGPSTRPGRYTILEHLALSPFEIRGRLAEYADALADRPDPAGTP